MPTILKQTRFHIQIACLSKRPEDNYVNADRWEGRGMRLPRAILYQIDTSDRARRDADWRWMRRRVISSVREGNNVYV